MEWITVGKMILQIITWIASKIADIAPRLKPVLDDAETIKSLMTMPDMKIEEKAQEIVKQQELAKSLVFLVGIEAFYNIARISVIVMMYAILVRFLRAMITKQ